MNKFNFYVPKLSLSLHIVGISIVCLLAGIVTAFKLHKSPGVEAIVNCGVLFALLCAYFSIILYRGFRFDNGIVKWRKSKLEFRDVADAMSGIPTASSFDFSFDDGFGFLGFIIGLIGVIFSVIIGVFLLYIGIEVTLIIGLCIVIPLYWLFRLSARIVLANSRRCKDNLSNSIFIGIKYAFIYSAIISIAFFAIDKIFRKIS